jgi:hypothetical protein
MHSSTRSQAEFRILLRGVIGIEDFARIRSNSAVFRSATADGDLVSALKNMEIGFCSALIWGVAALGVVVALICSAFLDAEEDTIGFEGRSGILYSDIGFYVSISPSKM